MNISKFHYRVHLKLPNTDTGHIDIWTEKHFGIRGIYWDCWFADDSPFNYDMVYAFSKHEDAVLFTLTWE